MSRTKNVFDHVIYNAYFLFNIVKNQSFLRVTGLKNMAAMLAFCQSLPRIFAFLIQKMYYMNLGDTWTTTLTAL